MRAGMRFDGPTFAKASASDRRDCENGSWLKPFLAPFQRALIEGLGGAKTGDVTVKNFQGAADRAREQLSGTRAWVFVKRSELEAAIALAVTELVTPVGFTTLPHQRSNMRHGLQMYGVHVKDDDRSGSPLRLANADLPFSLRFIACSFAMPMTFSNARLVTLDLSGCAVPGIDATFLKLEGSLRLRRLYSSAPLDFTGARIHGFLDGADMLLQPFGRHPAAQAVSPERAMLGLNQVQIDNEIRLQRAQIWGGITMRGLEAKRSIYMSDAVVLCPLAVLEAMAKGMENRPIVAPADKIYDLPGTGKHKRSRDMRRWRKATWARGWSTEQEAAFESFSLQNAKWKSSTLHALLTSNLRARTNAIRADGIKIAGSMFMERLSCHGRMRMKYAQIEGGVTLAGARLRSTEALMETFDKLAYGSAEARQIHDYRQNTYNPLVDPEDRGSGKPARGADIFALDMRETRIKGDVRIGITDAKVPEEAGWSTTIDGSVAFDQAGFDGKLLVERVKFTWSVRLEREATSLADYQDALKAVEDARTEKLKENSEHQLSARGLRTADTINLCGSKDLKGADFSNATIGGDLLFWADWEHPQTQGPPVSFPSSFCDALRLQQPAQGLDGAVINLAGAQIAGDLRLLFDPKERPQAGSTAEIWLGPSIKAERVAVKGVLSIMPPETDVLVDAASYCAVVDRAQSDKLEQRTWAAKGKEEWQAEIEKRGRSLPVIDLSNAAATLLEFPPAAWPRTGQLMISGFSYQRAQPQGPLGPHPSGDDLMVPNHIKKRAKFWRSIAYILIAVFLIAMANIMLVFFNIIGGSLDHVTDSYFSLLGLFLLTAIYILIPLGKRPYSMHVVPMAMTWLDLQPAERNPYRTKYLLMSWIKSLIKWCISWCFGPGKPEYGNIFQSLEPYSIAADALRREGRWVSANLVEQERSRVRNGQLSWRIHLLQKFAFTLSDWATEYGYNYARLLFCTALAIILTATTVEKAEDCGAIVPKVQKVNLLPPLAARPDPDSMLCPMVKDKAQTVAEEPNLDVMLFAADTVLPIADLGEVADWEVSRQMTALGPWAPDEMRKHVTYARLLGLFHVLGLLLAGVLLLGLSTRFGQWLSRYAD